MIDYIRNLPLEVEWDHYEEWACPCGRHTYSTTFVRYMRPEITGSPCDWCGTGATTFRRTTYRNRQYQGAA